MATIKDVAKYAGVSPATVSNVLNETKYVSEELCNKVKKAVEELHYHPDYIATSMKRKTTQTIGVVVSTLNLIFISQVINGIQSVASKNDYKLIFYSSDNSIHKEMKYVDMLVNSKVDGIILNTIANEKKHADYIRYLQSLQTGKKPIPIVSLERNLSKLGIRSVHVNNRLGGQIATEHLVNHDCNNIALVTGPMFLDLTQDRYSGYLDILKTHNISFDKELICTGDFTPNSGYQAAKHLIAEGIHFDSIFACNDEMAIGVLKALKEADRIVPEDVKIVGFDNTFVTSLVTPSISTINVPKFRMGSCATQMLIDYLQDNTNDQMSCELPIDLTIRNSTESDKNVSWDLEKW